MKQSSRGKGFTEKAEILSIGHHASYPVGPGRDRGAEDFIPHLTTENE